MILRKMKRYVEARFDFVGVRMCWFLLLFLCLVRSEDKLCQRIYLQHGKETEMPYVQLEGVYKRIGDDNGHPIFKHEQRKYFLEYHGTDTNMMYFGYVGTDGRKKNAKVKIAMSNSFMSSLWKNQISNTEFPFESFIRTWYYYDANTNTHDSVSKNKMKLKCVDDGFVKCSSDRLFWNESFTGGNTILHNISTDYFELLPSVYVNNRQVYRHNKQSNYFLFYQSSYWVVGPEYTKAVGMMKVLDSPLRPEYIVQKWEYWDPTAQLWKFLSPVSLRCGGVTQRYSNSTAEMCSSLNPCLNNSKCVNDIHTNETLCVCADSFKGPTCSERVSSCGNFSSPSLAELSFGSGSQESDIVTVFCKLGCTPNFYFSQCRDNGTSRWTSGYCRRQPTTWSRWSPPASTAQTWSRWSPLASTAQTWSRWSPLASTAQTWSPWSNRGQQTRDRKPFNFDDYGWARPVLLSVVSLLQVLVPIAHMFCGIVCEKSGCRIISMHAYLSFICWIAYLSGCAYTKCTQHGKVFSDFAIMSFVMIPFCYLAMLLESCCASENKYVSNILQDVSAVDYLTELRNTDPERIMMIECWHMETKTRTVYYTDSQGNAQSRTETYQEKVVTYTERETFPIGYTQDLSNPAGPTFDSRGVTRLKLTPDVTCGDTETSEKFEEIKGRLLLDNAYRDTHIDFMFEDNIPGFKKRICAYVDVRFRPFWMNLSYFWIASLLGCSWPFRMLFRWKTTKAEYTIRKQIFLRCPDAATSPFADSQSPPPSPHEQIGLVSMTANGSHLDVSRPQETPNSVRQPPMLAPRYPPYIGVPGTPHMYPPSTPNEPPPTYSSVFPGQNERL